MKILIGQRVGGAFGYITDGWLNAARDQGHSIERWNGERKDWLSFNPDIYLGCSGHKQKIPQDRSNCKVAIHVNPLGPVLIDGISESRANIEWVIKQKPDLVFGYGTIKDKIYWEGWTKSYGINWCPMPCAGDKIIFRQITDLSDRKYDMVYLGGRWPYKARTIDSYLLKTVEYLKEHSKTYKVHGWGDWPKDTCSGALSEDKACEFLNSGKIAPCIAELHTHQYGIDIPERAFKAALCGCLVIHDAVPFIREMIPSAVVAQNPDNFKELCLHYINNVEERETLIKKQQEEVLNNQTYHNRLENLFKSFT